MLAANSVLTLISLYRSIKLQVVHKFLSNFTFYTEALPVIAHLHIPRNNLYLERLGGRPPFYPTGWQLVTALLPALCWHRSCSEPAGLEPSPG